MKYNPAIHYRRSIRLKGYDYSQNGVYFITICTAQKRCLFGDVDNNQIQLNEFGTIANDEWIKLSDRFLNIKLDQFVIMPNHIHGIINVGATLAVAQVGDIVGAYKSLVAKRCLDIFKSKNETMGRLWQRNYYDHIIRNEQSLAAIREYIVNNPSNWPQDELYHAP